MDLADLPQFGVEEIRLTTGEPEVRLIGHLSHLRGVRNETAWLYRTDGPSIIGTIVRVPSTPAELIEYSTMDVALAPEMRVGAMYPWIDGYWQAYHVAMVLAGKWTPRVFSATPAHYFRLAGVRGWQPEGGMLPLGAEDLGVQPDAWDHEHCELCQARIGVSGDPSGYVDPEDHWLCVECYSRYGITRDVSFVAKA